MTIDGKFILPSEMDDKHLVNCIRLLEKRYTHPQQSAPIYNDMVLTASGRGIAMDATRAEMEVDEQLVEQDEVDVRLNKAKIKAQQYTINKSLQSREHDFLNEMQARAEKAERSAIAHKAVATRRLNTAKKARKEKLFKDMTKNKVAVKRVDIRQRRIILED